VRQGAFGRPDDTRPILTLVFARVRAELREPRVSVSCDACGSPYNPLTVPCGSVFCGPCWRRLATAFDLPQGTVRCWTEGACLTSGGPAAAYVGLQRQIGQLAGLYGGKP